MGRPRMESRRGGTMPELLRVLGLLAIALPAFVGVVRWVLADPYLPMFIHSTTPVQGRADLLPAPQEPIARHFAKHFGIVDLANGEIRYTEVDLRVPSRGIDMDFIWQRRYTSRSHFDHGHGFNWDFNYNKRIVDVSLGASPRILAVSNGMGREDTYTETAATSNIFHAVGLFDVILDNGSGSYTQTLPNGTVCQYAAHTGTESRLASCTDRAGNACTITRNAFGNITNINDSQDRNYSIAYDTATAIQRIVSLTDFSGRQVVYTYSPSGDLIRKRSPVVVGTPTGNDSPNGKTTLYTYDTDPVDPLLSHNLTSVIEPGYNVSNDPAQSKAWITFKFYGVHNPEHLRYDRVQSVRWGHDQGGPPQNPNVVVGGTTMLFYQDNLTGDVDAPVGAVFLTREDD